MINNYILKNNQIDVTPVANVTGYLFEFYFKLASFSFPFLTLL